MHTFSPPHLKIPNQIFNLQLAVSVDAKSREYGSLTAILLKKITYNWNCKVQTHVTQGSTVYEIPMYESVAWFTCIFVLSVSF